MEFERMTRNDSEDCLSILVATDNHLGYLEKDPIRGNDSLNTFKEILEIAKDQNVDMVLLGGDLFHDNKPSRKTLFETMKLLRSYCFGGKECNIELEGNLCALDILSVSGLVNYFGKAKEIDNIIINPVQIKKDGIKLALYGLGNMRDERLHRMFDEKNVKINKISSAPNDWFNLMVLHQNRVPHGPKNYIPETFLPSFMDLIIWGHEHDCRIDYEYNSEQGFYISQPGSSIATSLIEAKLEIRGPKQFCLERIRLRTVRPFVIGEIALKDIPDISPDDAPAITSALNSKVEELIEEAKDNWLEINDEVDESKFPLPLIRLRVDYTGEFGVFNNRQFGQNFVNRVANNQEILLFHRNKKISSSEMDVPENISQAVVNDLISECLETLDILPENALGESITHYVDKDDQDAIEDFYDEVIDNVRKQLNKDLTIADDKIVAEQAHKQKMLFFQRYAEMNPDERYNERTRNVREPRSLDDEFATDDDHHRIVTTNKGSRARGTKSTRGRGTRGRKKATTTRKKTINITDDDDFSFDSLRSTSTTNSTTSATKRAAALRSTAKVANILQKTWISSRKNRALEKEGSEIEGPPSKKSHTTQKSKVNISRPIESRMKLEDDFFEETSTRSSHNMRRNR
ncbi:8834_t:CDS:10 [Diversispora eburnea]|uniref:Double-strand break repair protein n=1 Tax=Diversispora eburnea TaxID=1213867 RepID=A0A9N9BVK4_9GLOM|nr:8834_t:CDS:10 [Diversispora eburnea]